MGIHYVFKMEVSLDPKMRFLDPVAPFYFLEKNYIVFFIMAAPLNICFIAVEL